MAEENTPSSSRFPNNASSQPQMCTNLQTSVTKPAAQDPSTSNQQQTAPNCRTETSFHCGLLTWRPSWLRRAANIKVFLAAVCFISCLQAAFSGYFSSQVTTLEKRFAIGSSLIGIMNSFFEIGYIISVMFVSYAGGRGHVPRWIASGLFFMSLGAILWSLPHFIFTQPVIKNMSVTSTPICQLPFDTPVEDVRTTDALLTSTCSDVGPSGYGFLPVFLVAHLLVGAGSSPILTLSPPFIDDHVPPTRAPPMIASQYAAAAMGPVFGFGLGALILQYPADLHSAKRPSDPAWIGAWWAGFIVLGILVFVGALLLLLFPRKLGVLSKPTSCNSATFPACNDSSLPLQPSRPSEIIAKLSRNDSIFSPSMPTVPSQTQSMKTRACRLTSIAEAEETARAVAKEMGPAGKQVRRCFPRPRTQRLGNLTFSIDFLNTFVSIMRNRIYIMVCLCICSEMFLIMGFSSFLPKYLETEYQISKPTTSAIAGGLIVPSGALGILVGGFLLNHFKFHRRGAILFVLLVNLTIIGCIASFFFLGCNNPIIAGVTVAYPDSPPNTHANPPRRFISLPDLDSQCNSKCSCDPDHWAPVCHRASSTSFVSACYAGCRLGRSEAGTRSGADAAVFSNCSCVPLSSVTQLSNTSWTHAETSVTAGQCPFPCHSLVLFIAVLTTCLFLTGVIQNPLLMVTMRSVNHNERSFALGLQFVIIRILANVPSPMVFGRVIDGACRHWRYNCGRRGDCAFVDLIEINRYMTGLGLIVKGSGLVFYLILLCLLRSKVKSNGQPTESTGNSSSPNRQLHAIESTSSVQPLPQTSSAVYRVEPMSADAGAS